MDKEQRIQITGELTQGKELTEQLMNSPQETRELLIQMILSSYEKSLSLLNYTHHPLNYSKPESPSSLSFPNTTTTTTTSSPRSEVSDDHVIAYKKRKTMPRWTEQVKVQSGTGLEGTLDDGYCWRKYGQKDILGANFPRGYYRCTHRHAQGCLATKQVQRSDADPTIFEVTYRGRHSCTQLNSHFSSSRKHVSIIKHKNHTCSSKQEPKQSKEIITTEHKVKTDEEDLDATGRGSIFPPFTTFPQESTAQLDNLFFGGVNVMENDLMTSFISPPTSHESNYFSMSSPCHMNTFGLGHNNNNVQTPDQSDLTAEIISTPTSVTNSPFENFDFDPDFLFQNLDSF